MLCKEATHFISYPVKFRSHRYCGSGYIIMILVCHVISQKRDCGFVTLWVEATQSKHYPSNFCSSRNSDSGDKISLIGHMTSQNLVIICSCDLL